MSMMMMMMIQWVHMELSIRSETGQMLFQLGSLIALSSSKEAAILEHVLRCRIECPIVALTGIAGLSRNLDKTVIQRQIMTNAVLPMGEFLPIIRESIANEFTDARQGEFLVGRLKYGHGDEGNVGEGRLDCCRFGGG